MRCVLVCSNADSKRHNTRKMFDEYCQKRSNEILKEKLATSDGTQSVSDERAKKPFYKNTGYRIEGGCDYYENNLRYAAYNYELPIPLYAVPQPNFDLRWSYIHDDWIAPKDFNWELERKKYKAIKEEILAKRRQRAEKREKKIEDKLESYSICIECAEKGIEVCSIYDKPVKEHPNRKKKKYKNFGSDRQYRFLSLTK